MECRKCVAFTPRFYSTLKIYVFLETTPAYKKWRGIVFLFGCGGAIDQGIPPKLTGGRDEQYAVELTQSDFAKNRRVIEQSLSLFHH